MAKDRARPFSRKHRRVWLPVTGGMILIGTINVALGYCSYEPPPPGNEFERIDLKLPDASVARDAVPPPADAGFVSTD